MSYQSICRGLYKKASSEQLRKLASLIGMRKKAADYPLEPGSLAQNVEKSFPTDENLALSRLGRGIGAYGGNKLVEALPPYTPPVQVKRDTTPPWGQEKQKYEPSLKDNLASVLNPIISPFNPIARRVGPAVVKTFKNIMYKNPGRGVGDRIVGPPPPVVNLGNAGGLTVPRKDPSFSEAFISAGKGNGGGVGKVNPGDQGWRNAFFDALSNWKENRSWENTKRLFR